MKNKTKKNSGSAMILAIICIAIFTIFAIGMYYQLSNKIKFTFRSHKEMQLKYANEAGVERSIANIQNQILELIKNSKNEKEKIVYKLMKTSNNKVNNGKIKGNLSNAKKQWEEVSVKVTGKYKKDIDKIVQEIISLEKDDYNDRDINKVIVIKDECIKLNKRLEKEDKKYTSYKNNIEDSIVKLGYAFDAWYEESHENHKKVEFNTDGIPKWSSFNELIVRDLGHSTQNDSIALLGDNMHWYILNSVGSEKANKLRTKYQSILSSIDNISDTIYSNTMDKDKIRILKIDIDTCISEIKVIISYLHSIESNSVPYVKEALDHSNRMIKVLEEIKCRLSMDSSDDEQIKRIKIPVYKTRVNSITGDLVIEQDSQNYVDVILDFKDNNLIDIDFSELNSSIIMSHAYLDSDIDRVSNMESKVEFRLVKISDGKYVVNYDIKSYGK